MLETNHWVQIFFERASDATFIFADGQLLAKNAVARQLIAELQVDPAYLEQLVTTAVDQHESSLDNCTDCTILAQMPNHIIPLTLISAGGERFAYSLTYQILDPKSRVFAIELKSQLSSTRADQLAHHRQLTRYVSRAHEEERKKIAQDLHDSIAQGLYSARIGIRRIKDSTANPKLVTNLADLVETQLDDTLSEVKGLALDVRPAVLDSFGLVAAIKALTKRLEENSGVEFNVLARLGDLTLNEDVKSVLYRITQESISNALRHAHPFEITVILIAHDQFISLEVTDDGDGFELNQPGEYNGHSMGLMNMNDRVKALNGSFEITSAKGAGTTVIVHFPLPARHRVDAIKEAN